MRDGEGNFVCEDYWCCWGCGCWCCVGMIGGVVLMEEMMLMCGCVESV